MKKIITVIFTFFITFSSFAQGQRWSAEKANNWYKQFSWLNGINYIPANAINYTAMLDKTNFSPDIIEKEMALAQSIGMNCARVVLQHAVYEDDPAYFLFALDKFLEICDKYGVKVMPCFFDDCAFGVNTDPKVGMQPEPYEGWYAWAWSPSPGYTLVVDARQHYKLERYVKEVMNRFKNDERIFVWDLYNEPTNMPHGVYSLPLVEKVFSWAREINPVQPLTIGVWNEHKELNEFILANSDIITFHFYNTKETTEARMKELLALGRPLICTEWMNRVAKSYVEEIMPVFKAHNVGSMLWGLVNGKTQTHLPWGHRPEKLPYSGEWQHDLYHGDFTPYSQKEIDLIKKLNGIK
jgi:Cellulase (glycosyl hydrolase family 5).